MTLSLLFWILLLLWIVLGLKGASVGWPTLKANWQPASASLLLFALIVILGWGIFGAPIK